jgi:hypothetical protein
MAEPVIDAQVELVCVKEGSRLRVRIVTPGYLPTANCMFPRDLRAPGARFRTPARNVTLITSRAKWFYSVGKRDPITRIDAAATTKPAAIYEDATMTECAICLENPKSVIVNPCGHFYMCAGCAAHVKACPMCRGPIVSLIDRAQME